MRDFNHYLTEQRQAGRKEPTLQDIAAQVVAQNKADYIQTYCSQENILFRQILADAATY